MIETIKQQAGGSAIDSPSLGGTVKPAYLELWIGKRQLAKIELNYMWMATATEKQQYQEREAAKLMDENMSKIIRSGEWPVFYVTQESKMQ